MVALVLVAALAAFSGPLPDPPPLLWHAHVGSITAPINAEIAVVDLPTSPPSTRLFVSTGASVAALNPQTGKLLWNSSAGIPLSNSSYGSGPQGYATPVYESGSNLVLAVLSTKYGTVVAIDATTGKLRWAFNASITPNINFYTYAGTPVVIQNSIFGAPLVVVNVNGVTIALRVHDGHEVWRNPFIPSSSSHQSCSAMLPLSSRDGKVYCCSASGGWLLALDSATGQPLWKSSVRDGAGCVYPGVMLGPKRSVLVATAGGRTIARSKEPHLLAFDDNTGSQRWNTSLLYARIGQTFATIAGAAMSPDQTTVVAVQLSTPASTIDALTGEIITSGTGGGIPNPGGSPHLLRFNGPISFDPTNHSRAFAITYGQQYVPFCISSYDVRSSSQYWKLRWYIKDVYPAGLHSVPAFASSENGGTIMLVGDTNGTVRAWKLDAAGSGSK